MIFYTVLGKLSTLAITIIGFTAVISIHEFGHFIFARIFGVKVSTFSIGMGPSLIKKKIWGTDFTISQLPIGGYVEINVHDELKPEEAPKDSFTSKPYWQKFLIMFGGILFNILSAYLVYFLIFSFSGMPSNKIVNLKITEVLESSPAKNKILPGDLIVGMNQKNFSDYEKFSMTDFIKTIYAAKGKKLNILLNRESKNLSVDVDIPESDDKFGILKVRFDQNVKYLPEEKLSFLEAIKESFNLVYKQIRDIGNGVYSMIKRRSIQGAAGPVMILSESFKIAENGIIYLLIFLCFISISLAITNVLPLGMLDGGQILTVTIESIIGKPLPLLKTIIFAFSAVAIGALTIFLSYHEILSLVKPLIG